MSRVDSALVRDVVVVIPGIMGSELVDAENNPVWSVSTGGLAHAIHHLGTSLQRLELPAAIGDNHPGDGIRASRLMDSLHVIPGLWSPITGYDGLVDFLRSPRFHLVEARDGNDVLPNLVQFPYDWRLSNRYNGRLLAATAMDALERWREQPGMEDAKLILVCHSMGGLVARWFAECEGGAGHIRAIVTIGTPHRGSVKALGTLVNGLTPGLGPLRLSLTRFARSLPSLYQLLPQYDCMVTESGRRGVRDASCPNLSTAMLDDANAFHTSLDVAPSYVLHKVVGIRQPTFTTAGVRGDEVELFEDIDGLTQGGDGTVARLAAEPVHTRGHEVHEVANQHGELQGDRSVLDLVDGILTREDLVWQSGAVEGFGVRMDDVVPVGVPVPLQVTSLGDRRLWVTVHDESGAPWGQPVLVRPDGLAMLGPFPEGGYRAVVAPRKPGRQPTVTRPFLAFDGHA